jgi:CoA:oxalate CoA-transferase
MTDSGPLAGLRVIDAGTYFSAPYAAMMLGDLGATVVKVEAPGKGDPFRWFLKSARGVASMFINVNRGKESVVLDLKEDRGRRELLALVRDADVFIHNWRPGVAESLGLEDSVLSQANPRLIRVAISGYGQTGPYAGRPAFDALLQAESGLAHYEAVGGEPRLNRTSIPDKVTAIMAAQAVLAAVVARSKSGEGQLLELSILDALAYFNFPDMFQDRTFVDDEEPTGSVTRTPSLLVPTSDGHVIVQPITGAQLKRTCLACERPGWVDELRQCPPSELRVEVHRRLTEALAENTSDHWVKLFVAHDIPVAPVVNLSEHLADAQVAHNQIYEVDEHPAPLGRVRRVRYPTRFSRTPTSPRFDVPSLDADPGAG